MSAGFVRILEIIYFILRDIDEFFNKELSEILERVQKNELNWKYDEEFWNDFILKEIKNV